MIYRQYCETLHEIYASRSFEITIDTRQGCFIDIALVSSAFLESLILIFGLHRFGVFCAGAPCDARTVEILIAGTYKYHHQ